MDRERMRYVLGTHSMALQRNSQIAQTSTSFPEIISEIRISEHGPYLWIGTSQTTCSCIEPGNAVEC